MSSGRVASVAVADGRAVDKDGYHGAYIVEISAASTEGHAVIEVRDNGGGVAPGAAHRLFSLSSPSDGGTGIGLYLSSSLAERNGGSLSYVPLSGGSCFRLVFPLAPDPPIVA